MERRIELLDRWRLSEPDESSAAPQRRQGVCQLVLSRKGQMALQKLGDVDDPANSRRIDIPKDGIPADNLLQPGVKYFDVVKPEYGDMKPIFDLARKIMAETEKGK